MRSPVRIVCFLNLFFLFIAFTQVYDLLTQLNDSGLAQYLVTKEGIAHSTLTTSNEYTDGYLIPPIIHQTYKTENIPKQWADTRDTIIETNSDYTYMFWTDENGRKFIADHYAWFLDTYDSYKFPIMRSDALRYFILYHYGGFYVDLDIGVKQSMDEMRKLPTAFYKTSPVGVSNDFMASMPQHPFMLYLIKSLSKYNRNWFVAYLTVMYGTGPLFVSVLLQKYTWKRSAGITEVDDTAIYLLRASESSKYKPLADFIYHIPGSSWHKNDAWVFVLINDHQVLAALIIPLLVTAGAVGVVYLEIKLAQYIRWYWRRRRLSNAYRSPQN